MMEIAILILALILIVAIVSFSIRRKRKKEIERLEQKRKELENRPISEQLTRVKDLNMDGQAEELFDRWRAEWDEVVSIHMPAIKTLLYEADEAIDRLRFSKAQEIEKEIEEYIEQCHSDMDNILAELEHLIGSEAQSRVEVEQLKEHYRNARKTLLAHQYSFGPALYELERRLEIFAPSFEQYEELTEEGNYLHASELVKSLVGEAVALEAMIVEIPDILTELQTSIPATISDLRAGHREMEQQGYYLKHLEMISFLDELEAHLHELLQLVQQLELDKVKPSINVLIEELDFCYDQLEKEVISRVYVERNAFNLQDRLLNELLQAKELITEAIFVQQSYRLESEKADKPKRLAKELELLQRRYDVLLEQFTDGHSAFTSLEADLQDITASFEKIAEEQASFAEYLKTLRVEEMDIRVELDELRKELHEVDRKLHKANIPGIPDEMRSRVAEVEEQLFVVEKSLEEVPLNMVQIRTNVKVAKELLEGARTKVIEMVENVILFEHTIRYGNRYRATHPDVQKRFRAAERSFTALRYTKALEEAGVAVSQVDPKALEAIQRLAQDDLYKATKL
ncbi:hypothetical protein A6K76_12285 [Caryophanon latum]|uniref:Septation ring formation regulator EzrA n=2 Tax=Caryophanon latum TaxID=33977 RepID=A0A1C0YRA5_9BACL|nr:hypothetical protein A6K76_12285 [Caryophanon latum]